MAADERRRALDALRYIMPKGEGPPEEGPEGGAPMGTLKRPLNWETHAYAAGCLDTSSRRCVL